MEGGHEFELAVLDFALFSHSSTRAQFADALLDSLSTHGFAKIVNHGISDAFIQHLFEWSKRFFDLPVNVKHQIEHEPGPDPQRGWSSVGSESTAKVFGALTPEGDKITETDMKVAIDLQSSSSEFG
ncbi:hypothetical protein NQ176_g1530 [Zarea fungicola]|uniref:Uncharacterized protein n=2 Tax=Zarea fungicola TaxID=93591 RepID=A0ACC1N1I6_9HYPO|nr:hypothetical protein NQ176_g6876 [Lecanicillium fungicola]KAJ2982218.1 hypothetical protein NQ176_g1530 [Lecanicillium fungicola]